MKSILILFSLIITTSIACAETYKWEDANGMHFTDNPTAVPEKFRAKVLSEPGEDISAAKSRAGKSLSQQSNAIQAREKQEDIKQVNTDRTAEVPNPQQFVVKTQKNIQAARTNQNGVQPLERIMATGIFLMFIYGIALIALFVTEIVCLIDIVKSEFKDSSNKIVWVLLVLFFPPITVPLYLIIGRKQKKNYVAGLGNESAELLARLSPKQSHDGDFDIR